MPVKWDLPPEPIPSWLDPATEVLAEHEPPKADKYPFALRCVDVLLAMGLTHQQAFEVAANAVVETGWGQHYRAFNLGGWKIRKDFVDAYLKKFGRSPKWWRAPGNKSSGDRPWCYYRGFDSIEEFFAAWLETFVPKPGARKKSRYLKTGEEFWAGRPWFDDLIEAGYKGAVTKKSPEGSIHGHDALTAKIRVLWAQRALGVAIDGKFGPKSRAALVKFQHGAGLEAHGRLDEPTLAKLTRPR